MTQFHSTKTGQNFFRTQMPALISALHKIGRVADKIAKQDAALAKSCGPRVLITVSGGVVDDASDGADVCLIDYDNEPDAKVPRRFADLAGPQHAEIADDDSIEGALRWLLDDLADAGEDRHLETGKTYDSIANARRALGQHERLQSIAADGIDVDAAVDGLLGKFNEQQKGGE